jgi:hypothetical protein
MVVRLYDYHWDGSSYVLSGTITIDPEPSSIKKSAKVEWRVRHAGINELKKHRWRYRRTEEITLEGIVTSETARLTLEAVATRNSKYVLDLGGRFSSPASEGTDYGSTLPATSTTAYYIVTDFSCNQVPGKTVYEYSIKFERVLPP